VNVGVAALALAAFVALVGGPVYLGMRQRPMLEIPPNRWEEPEPLPRWLGRLRITGLLAFLTGTVLFLVMAALDLRSVGLLLAMTGWSVYFGSVLVRTIVSIRLALKARKRQGDHDRS
jgi:hypothetical protein